MIDRIASGATGLDAVLDGGLPRNAINLVAGLPGSGKTILAQKYAFTNATPKRPALYLLTASEPFEKVLRYGQTLSFFDTSLIGSSVFYEDLGGILAERGLGAALDRIDALIRQHRPGVVVIDSFRALHAFAPDAAALRRFLHDLAGRLTAFPSDVFWIGEYAESDISQSAEFTIADAILHLSATRLPERQLRMLEVLKVRGSDFLSGRHGYRITPHGLEVFPRLADPAEFGLYELPRERISSGIAGLDEMLGGEGYWPGAATLVAGPSGIGKTILGLHFIFNGAAAGEPGLIATLQENPTQLERVIETFGWSLDDGTVDVMYRSPVDIYIDQWFAELMARIDAGGVRRILIDSLDDLRFTTADEIRFREYMYSLVQRCARRQITLMMSLEIPDITSVRTLSDFSISHLADNVILLQYHWDQGHIRRSLAFLKARASPLDTTIREYTVTTKGGITLGGVITT